MTAPEGPILLVEDTPSLSMVYETVLRKAGHDVHCALTAAAARTEFDRNRNRIILLDLLLPDADGIDLLHDFMRVNPRSRVIVITANGSINRAVEAMRGGAFDFLVKPFDEKRLLSAVDNAIVSLSSDPPQQEREVSADRFEGFVGSSPQMRAVYQKVRNIGRSTATVFVTGESGTGKEVCAQAIHAMSTRASGPFVPLNCGAIPKDLLESEVFGHLKGSFTGAIADKPGAAAAADGGTLFMDEICELSLDLQTKLLRFLQTSMIQPVGAATPHKVDVRIVCATNRDPFEEVRAGRFREDLFYRLHVVPIHLPPLRDRGDDVIEIAETFLEDFSREEGKRFRRLSPEVKAVFRAYPWPGNVRQLQNSLRNVVVLNEGEEVGAEMLPPEIRMPPARPDEAAPGMRAADPWDRSAGGPGAGIAAFPDRHGAARGYAAGAPTGRAQPWPPAPGGGAPAGRPGASGGRFAGDFAERAGAEAASPGAAGAPAAGGEGAGLAAHVRPLVGATLSEVERELIEATIDACDGSIPKAARVLDVSPSTLYRKRESWSRDAG